MSAGFAIFCVGLILFAIGLILVIVLPPEDHRWWMWVMAILGFFLLVWGVILWFIGTAIESPAAQSLAQGFAGAGGDPPPGEFSQLAKMALI